MKQLIASLALVCIPIAMLYGASPEQANIEAELKRLHHELGQSFVNRDIDTTSKIELDDFILADHLGKLWTKAEHIAATKDSLLTSFDVDDVKVMVHGSAAIMTGCFTTKGKEDGKDISGRYRFTDTWLLHDGKWRLAACAIAKMP